MRIVIIWAFWCQNLWDELILKNEIEYFDKKYENAFFRVFTYDLENIFFHKNNVEYLAFFPDNIKKINKIFYNIKNFFLFLKEVFLADKIVFWWWWIIYDNEIQSVSSPLNMLIFRRSIAKLFNKKVEFFSISINIKNKENINKLRNIFLKGDKIKVRDEKSFNILKKIWREKNAQIMKDIVFEDRNYSNYKLEKKGYLKGFFEVQDFNINDFLENIENIGLENKKVWLSLRYWFLKEEVINKIVEKIEKKWWKVIFTPHSFHKKDEKANDYLFMKKFINQDRYITKNMQDSYNIYLKKEVDFMISMRLHSSILAYNYWIDFILISYADKTKEIKKDFV